jgi:hypothetical protein
MRQDISIHPGGRGICGANLTQSPTLNEAGLPSSQV